MRKFLFLWLVLCLLACNPSSQTIAKQQLNQKNMNETSYFSNKQLAYEKKDNKVAFYNYKGEKWKELDLGTRIERRYNLTGEIHESNIAEGYVVNLGAGHYAYPDVVMENFRGAMSNAAETVDGMRKKVFPKNNIGLPTSVIQVNEWGLITQTLNEKRTYDDLGRITQRTYFSDFSSPAYKAIDYQYEGDHLKSSKHQDKQKQENFTRTYSFDKDGNLNKVIEKKGESIHAISIYHFQEDLLASKKVYTQREEYIDFNSFVYQYDGQKRCLKENHIEISAFLTASLEELTDFNKEIDPVDVREEIVTTYYYEQDLLSKKNKVTFYGSSQEEVDSEIEEDLVYHYNDKKQLIKREDVLSEESISYTYENK